MNLTSSIREYYFTDMPVRESPMINLSVLSFGVFIALAFFTMAFPEIAGLFVVLAFGSVAMGTILHISLFLAGKLYILGFIEFTKRSAFVIVAVVCIVLVGGFALYGWFIPLMLFAGWFNNLPNSIQSILLPFVIIGMVVFAFSWYAKGLDALSSH